MENNKIGHSKENMVASKPPLIPILSFQSLQKTFYRDAPGTSNSTPQNENNRLENPADINPALVASESTPKLIVDQTQAKSPDADLKKLRRMESNRLSSRRSWMKKLIYLTNLENQVKNLEDQLAQLRPQIASHESQKQFLMLEKQTLLQRMEILEKEINFRESDLEMKKEQVKYLRESYPMNQAKQLQEQFLNWNIGLQDPMSNDPIPNYYTNSDQVAGNYELETSYMLPADLSQMWMPNVPNMNEVNLSLPNNMGSMVSNVYETNLSHPNYMGSMVSNVYETNLSHPNYIGPMTPNMDGMNLNLPNYTGSMAPSDMNAMQFSLPNNMGQMVPIMDETNLNLPNFMGSMAPEMNEMNFSLPSNIGSMAPNPPSGTFPNPNLD
ncbi:hypothetical protein AAZX31_11G192900 [Glycine max]|uniref:BZIP domain-containing protein n=1 Tax=Glycine max TaxID=3847 RepID=A0A0R0HI77_SOYBN|nr:hypothetical protein GYH30_031484 [Glycine max]KRH30206.1 hypothetical protein GLYMA_11G167400v4 [Glycine max]|eukprot:XP_006591244.2 uncharacterized protein LOC102667304 isoform X1 [Glycine max]